MYLIFSALYNIRHQHAGRKVGRNVSAAIDRNLSFPVSLYSLTPDHVLRVYIYTII